MPVASSCPSCRECERQYPQCIIPPSSFDRYDPPSNLNNYWETHGDWYESHDINKSEFSNFPFKNGINKGDIIIVTGYTSIKEGKVIIFNSQTKYPRPRSGSETKIGNGPGHALLSAERY